MTYKLYHNMRTNLKYMFTSRISMPENTWRIWPNSWSVNYLQVDTYSKLMIFKTFEIIKFWNYHSFLFSSNFKVRMFKFQTIYIGVNRIKLYNFTFQCNNILEKLTWVTTAVLQTFSLNLPRWANTLGNYIPILP